MDPRIEVWQVLHDGEITVVRLDDHVLTMFVNIPYVRERIAPLGDSVVLRLRNLRSFSLLNSKGDVKSTDPLALSKEGFEILSVQAEAMPVTVELNMGSMQLDFDALEIGLDTGGTVSLVDLAGAHDSYWREFGGLKSPPKQEKR